MQHQCKLSRDSRNDRHAKLLDSFKSPESSPLFHEVAGSAAVQITYQFCHRPEMRERGSCRRMKAKVLRAVPFVLGINLADELQLPAAKDSSFGRASGSRCEHDADRSVKVLG